MLHGGNTRRNTRAQRLARDLAEIIAHQYKRGRAWRGILARLPAWLGGTPIMDISHAKRDVVKNLYRKLGAVFAGLLIMPFAAPMLSAQVAKNPDRSSPTVSALISALRSKSESLKASPGMRTA